MTDEKQGLADRFARWARMGNNGKDEKDLEEREMDEHGAATAEQASEGQVVEFESGADGISGEPAESSAAAIALEQVRGERDALRDRLARLQAEFDNARKRELKERQDSRDYATRAAVEPFLGVMDNFALALKSEGSLEQLRKGVELIVKQMDESLRTLHVQAVEAVGVPFDPHVHEALGSVETAEYPDNQVIEEIRRGYKLRDKLLRPALVRIATNAAQREA